MIALRVQKRGHGEHYTSHWLVDDNRTFCGRAVTDLQAVETYETEKLPPVEACQSCMRAADGWTPAAHVSADVKVTRTPSTGSVRKTGPLGHGTRISRGNPLL